jgi:lysophospholipase L1-like esterase
MIYKRRQKDRYVVLTYLACCVVLFSGQPGRAQQVDQSSGSPPLLTVADQLHNVAAIESFLQQLPPKPDQTLDILQIGDSHTAGDMITNGWREAWQAEFGPGGRGTMAVGKPYPGYLTWGVTAAQSDDWVVTSIFGRQRVVDGPAIGLSGYTHTASHAGANLVLAADSSAYMFDNFSLCGLTGPNKGAVNVVLGSIRGNFSFAALEENATCFQLKSPVPVSTVQVTIQDNRPVSLTSWDTRRKFGGIVLSNIGVVGTRLIHFQRNDDRVLGVELKYTHPDLLVIAFGTNEGFDPTLSFPEAETVMRTQIERIWRLLGYRVPILLLGPPDAATKKIEIAGLTKPETVSCGGGWYVPANLALIKQLQMRLAIEMHLSFWDWQAAMGGACASSRWVTQGLQRGDHVHFTATGGRALGQALAADLDKARLTSTGR